MPKSKSERMKPVNQLADKLEQEAAIEYAQCVNQVKEFEDQLQKLYLYRESYNQQMINQSRQGVGSHHLQDTLKFMSNLNHSIEGVLKQIQQQKTLCEQKKQLWLEKRNKKRIYGKVTEKYQHQEQQQRNKQEQKVADEYNQALFHRRIRTSTD